MDNKIEVPSMTTSSDIIADIISNLRPEVVPSEFIISAKLTLIDGSVMIVDGKELDQVMLNERQNVQSCRVTFDIRKIHNCINMHTTKVMNAVFGS